MVTNHKEAITMKDTSKLELFTAVQELADNNLSKTLGHDLENRLLGQERFFLKFSQFSKLF